MKICVIGAGIIGSAFAKSLLKSGYGDKIIVTRRRIEKLEELKALNAEVTRDNRKAAKEADVIVLSVKPKVVKKVLTEIKAEASGKLIISLAAAVPLDFLEKIAPESRFIRAMPNIAVLVQEAFTAYCTGSKVTKEDIIIAEEIFGRMGRFARVEEKDMDAITGLSGSGPAYISIMIEALTYAGLKTGLPRDLALLASAQTVVGAGKLVLETEKHPAELKEMVVTPAGTTIDGIYEIEESGIRTAIMRAVEAATKKSKDITEELKNNYLINRDKNV